MTHSGEGSDAKHLSVVTQGNPRSSSESCTHGAQAGCSRCRESNVTLGCSNGAVLPKKIRERNASGGMGRAGREEVGRMHSYSIVYAQEILANKKRLKVCNIEF